MKLRQKIYDSSESINRLIKITNSFHHYNNLKKIKERKPLYYNSKFNVQKNKKFSYIEKNKYYSNNNENNIIINSIDKMNYKDLLFGNNGNKNIGLKKEKDYNKKQIKNNVSNENRKNIDLKYKNNKNNFILPPIKKYNIYK